MTSNRLWEITAGSAYWLNLPLTMIAVLWAFIGRVFAGSAGWMVFVMLVFLTVPVCALLLVQLILTALPRPRRFSVGECIALVALCASIVGFGFFVVDVADTEDSRVSVLTQLVGADDTTLEVSANLAEVCAVVCVISWLALLVLMIRTLVMSRSRGMPPSPPSHRGLTPSEFPAVTSHSNQPRRQR